MSILVKEKKKKREENPQSCPPHSRLLSLNSPRGLLLSCERGVTPSPLPPLSVNPPEELCDATRQLGPRAPGGAVEQNVRTPLVAFFLFVCFPKTNPNPGPCSAAPTLEAAPCVLRSERVRN